MCYMPLVQGFMKAYRFVGMALRKGDFWWKRTGVSSLTSERRIYVRTYKFALFGSRKWFWSGKLTGLVRLNFQKGDLYWEHTGISRLTLGNSFGCGSLQVWPDLTSKDVWIEVKAYRSVRLNMGFELRAYRGCLFDSRKWFCENVQA